MYPPLWSIPKDGLLRGSIDLSLEELPADRALIFAWRGNHPHSVSLSRTPSCLRVQSAPKTTVTPDRLQYENNALCLMRERPISKDRGSIWAYVLLYFLQHGMGLIYCLSIYEARIVDNEG